MTTSASPLPSTKDTRQRAVPVRRSPALPQSLADRQETGLRQSSLTMAKARDKSIATCSTTSPHCRPGKSAATPTKTSKADRCHQGLCAVDPGDDRLPDADHLRAGHHPVAAAHTRHDVSHQPATRPQPGSHSQGWPQLRPTFPLAKAGASF